MAKLRLELGGCCEGVAGWQALVLTIYINIRFQLHTLKLRIRYSRQICNLLHENLRPSGSFPSARESVDSVSQEDFPAAFQELPQRSRISRFHVRRKLPGGLPVASPALENLSILCHKKTFRLPSRSFPSARESVDWFGCNTGGGTNGGIAGSTGGGTGGTTV